MTAKELAHKDQAVSLWLNFNPQNYIAVPLSFHWRQTHHNALLFWSHIFSQPFRSERAWQHPVASAPNLSPFPSCWLFFQLWNSVMPFSFTPHISLHILLDRKLCWHSCWVCFIQLFSSPVYMKADFISHLSFWCLCMPLLFWAVLPLWPAVQLESWQVFAVFIWGICFLSSAKLPWRYLFR